MFINPGADYSGWEKPDIVRRLTAWIATRDPEAYTGRVATLAELEPGAATA